MGGARQGDTRSKCAMVPPYVLCVDDLGEAKIQGVVVDEVLNLGRSWILDRIGYTNVLKRRCSLLDFVQYSTWKYNRPRNTTQEAKSEIARTAKYSEDPPT